MLIGHVAQQWTFPHEETDVLEIPDIRFNLAIAERAAKE
jgi:hypothetical protein